MTGIGPPLSRSNMRRGVERRYDYSMKRIVCTALLGLLASILPAQTSSNLQNSAVWKPPRILKSDALPKGTVSRLMVRALRISDLNVKLEETNMNQVQQRFGGTFGVQGDAGDSLEWLCLSGRDAGGRFVLWLKSGEMDAGTVGLVNRLSDTTTPCYTFTSTMKEARTGHSQCLTPFQSCFETVQCGPSRC
jgi:hypothetical protein